MTNKLIRLIPFLMPIAPALVLAVILHKSFEGVAGWWFAVAIASVLAIAFEAAIFQISHLFIQQAEAGNKARAFMQGSFMTIAAIVLMVIVASAKQTITNDLTRWILACMPLLGLFVYLGQGMGLSLDTAKLEDTQDKAEQQRRDKIEWEAKQENKRKDAEARRAKKFAQQPATPVATPVANVQHNVTPLQQSIQQLLQEGVTSKSEMARELGVNRSQIYRHYPTNGKGAK